jgi:hypothetical protein
VGVGSNGHRLAGGAVYSNSEPVAFLVHLLPNPGFPVQAVDCEIETPDRRFASRGIVSLRNLCCVCDQDRAAVFSFDKARILTRTLAGLAAPAIISPVAGLRIIVPAFRAGTFRSVTFSNPGNVNSPAPRGCTDPNNTFSSVAKTPLAVSREILFSSEMRLISADFERASLIGRGA